MARTGDVQAFEQLGHPRQALAEDLRYTRHALPLPGLDDRGCAEGQQAHQGANLKTGGFSVWCPQDVIVEAVLLIPHAVWANAVHGAGNPQELFGKFFRKILIGRIMSSDLDNYLEHALAVEGHPGRSVSLF